MNISSSTGLFEITPLTLDDDKIGVTVLALTRYVDFPCSCGYLCSGGDGNGGCACACACV